MNKQKDNLSGKMRTSEPETDNEEAIKKISICDRKTTGQLQLKLRAEFPRAASPESEFRHGITDTGRLCASARGHTTEAKTGRGPT